MSASTTKPLLTLGAMARRADVPTVRLSRLVRRGRITPDFRAGSMMLFLPERLPQIKQILASHHES